MILSEAVLFVVLVWKWNCSNFPKSDSIPCSLCMNEIIAAKRWVKGVGTYANLLGKYIDNHIGSLVKV